MTKGELIKELELLADSCDSNYALEMNGHNKGVLEALSLVNKYFDLAPVSGLLGFDEGYAKGYTDASREAAQEIREHYHPNYR